MLSNYRIVINILNLNFDFKFCLNAYFEMHQSVLRSRSRWNRNYLRPGAGAEIVFLINIYFSQFGG